MTAQPIVALWLLERCNPGSCRDALIGDLLEEIALGRSQFWVWQQVLAFCGFAAVDHLRDHRPHPSLIAFALGCVLLGSVWIAPSTKVLETWAAVYLFIGTISLFGDMTARAFDARPILFPFGAE